MVEIDKNYVFEGLMQKEKPKNGLRIIEYLLETNYSVFSSVDTPIRTEFVVPPLTFSNE
ncbi:hypothetical protein J14TS5_02300 [Paenibacillus lautus]|nr:hypothetical protein J14TS5_02300 [Paenibacillus lautus]